MSARVSGDTSNPGSRQNSLKPEEGALPMAPMSPRQRKLIGSMTDEQLKADIGRCPVPWWCVCVSVCVSLCVCLCVCVCVFLRVLCYPYFAPRFVVSPRP